MLKNITSKIHEIILYEKMKKVVVDRSVNLGFYKELLKAKLYVKGKYSGGNVRFETINNAFVSFISLDCLKRADQNLNDYVVVDAKSLLKSIPENHSLVINPGKNYGKEFFYHEIQDILNLKIPENQTRQIVFNKATKIRIGQPAEYPVALVDGLIEYMLTDERVDKAYLAWVQMEGEQAAHSVIGVKVSKEAGIKYVELVPKLGDVAQKQLGKGQYLDFIEITDRLTDMSAYMVQETKPFYDRQRDVLKS